MISSTKLYALAGQQNVLEQASMKSYTTFQAGGNADFLVFPENEEILSDLIQACQAADTPFFLLGRGSNLLVSDKGYHGVMISLRKYFTGMERLESIVTVGAGETLAKAAEFALQNGLSGLEFASGIPGTVGGGLFMNAGAYGSEMSNVVQSAKVLTPEGQILEVRKEDLDLSYRHSVCKDKNWLILSVTFHLTPCSRMMIKCTMEDYATRRKEKQPLNYASAGSTFKRPAGFYAGALIEEAGCKGMAVGDARVSEKHAGFIVNMGNASASDIYSLIGLVQKKVLEHSSVMLEPEVCLLGEF